MLALVQGSNRRDNLTRPVIDLLADRLRGAGREVEVVDLVELSGDLLHPGMYEEGIDHDWLAAAETTLKRADGWLLAFPEYNGSFPGALKLFFDALSVRDYSGLFKGRVAALVGTASGRSGNVKGMEHLSSVLQYVGVTVMPTAQPVSLIETLLSDDRRRVVAPETVTLLHAYADRFGRYVEAFNASAAAA